MLDEEQFLRVLSGKHPFRRSRQMIRATRRRQAGGPGAVTFKSLLDRLFPKRGSAEDPAIENPWIVIGLGNPGPKYRDTRHNAGHWCVERLVEETGAVP